MEEHLSPSHTDMQTLTHYVHERVCVYALCENKMKQILFMSKTYGNIQLSEQQNAY